MTTHWNTKQGFKRHKIIFNNGTKVILIRDVRSRPKMSAIYYLKAGQVFTVTHQGYYSADVPEDPWVRCEGIVPGSNDKYSHLLPIDVKDLVVWNEATELLYAEG